MTASSHFVYADGAHGCFSLTLFFPFSATVRSFPSFLTRYHVRAHDRHTNHRIPTTVLLLVCNVYMFFFFIASPFVVWSSHRLTFLPPSLFLSFVRLVGWFLAPYKRLVHQPLAVFHRLTPVCLIY